MRKILLLCIFFGAVFALSLQDFSHIKPTASGRFVQTKALANFPVKLFSSGEFSLLDGTLLWSVIKPAKSSAKITQDGVFVLQNGVWVASKSFSKEFFLPLLTFDFDALKSKFDFVLSGEKSAWQVELLPKGFFVKKAIKKVVLKGGEVLKSAEIFEPNGDYTKTEFFVK